MIKYHNYRNELLSKKKSMFYKYYELASITSTTKQNIQQILTGKNMGSHRTYKELEQIFQPSVSFINYVQQFKPILLEINLSMDFVAEAIGMTKLGLSNIIECRTIGQIENYMKLEEMIDKWEKLSEI
jgi:transcriptional regulator with XRE-family HTH domain